ncbi:acyl carrier protein [Vallitalea okinawensis]|uniref:acyl carrier protein n=1 Tax=Vallitalea okinawensis TaxID=2078660 RepID=UPI000CFBF3ED|nr:acyl carrier protein [Vallitalea okinawensis]
MEFEKIRQIIAEELNMNESDITEQTSLADDLGADSIDLFQIVMALEEEYNIEFSNEDAEKIKTVADAVEFIKNNA